MTAFEKALREHPEVVKATQAFVDAVMKAAVGIAEAAALAAMPGPLSAIAGLAKPLVSELESTVQARVDAEFISLEQPPPTTTLNPVAPTAKIVQPGSGVAGLVEAKEVSKS